MNEVASLLPAWGDEAGGALVPVWWCRKGRLSCFSQWRPFFPMQAVSLYWVLSPTLLGWQAPAGTLWEAVNLY